MALKTVLTVEPGTWLSQKKNDLWWTRQGRNVLQGIVLVDVGSRGLHAELARLTPLEVGGVG